MLLDELVRRPGTRRIWERWTATVRGAGRGGGQRPAAGGVSAGERWPAHVMAMGKAIMARLDDDALEELLVGGCPTIWTAGAFSVPSAAGGLELTSGGLR